MGFVLNKRIAGRRGGQGQSSAIKAGLVLTPPRPSYGLSLVEIS
ncbi:heavy metal sensor signal transduction histidine kinase [Acetobacter orientalis]|uniref:Heavy metal sensor signal transduction histidine kinase n=1 Tax=Acetobacter orientalis TaxID=146474 RepID=A0A2Z5ZJB5_9PROT|nr:heavy metal sensor signal transduction histidine kinase [Acetobacter orientalis]